MRLALVEHAHHVGNALRAQPLQNRAHMGAYRRYRSAIGQANLLWVCASLDVKAHPAVDRIEPPF
jgi:hypothetical protein